MLKAQLERIGLTPKEALLYETLTRHSHQPISFLARKAGLTRGTTYKILQSLAQKTLIESSKENKVQTFYISDPEQLYKYIEQQEAEISKKKQKIDAIIPELQKIASDQTQRPTFQYYYGVDGVRAAVEDTLRADDKNLRSYCSSYDMDKFLGTHFWANDYTSRRIEMGYCLNSIQSHIKDSEAVLRDDYYKNYGPSKKSRRDVRYSEDFALPITFYMYDDKTLIVTSRHEGFALIIYSREFSEMQKQLFDEIFHSLDHIDHE